MKAMRGLHYMASGKVLINCVEKHTHSVCFQQLVEIDCITDRKLNADLEAGYTMEIDRAELGALARVIDIAAVERSLDIALIRLRAVKDDYQLLKVPSEGDLFCMVYGRKAMASFCFSKGENEALMLAHQDFDKYVAEGQIKRHDFIVEADGRFVQQILFYQRGERWRATLMEALKRHLYSGSWSPHLEQIESYLLGYTELSDDWMMECYDQDQH